MISPRGLLSVGLAGLAGLLPVGLAAGVAGLLLAARPAAAEVVGEGDRVKVEQAAFERSISIADRRLELAGAGLFRWKWFVKVYAAAHWVEAGARGTSPSPDPARRLELSYLVGIDGPGFGKAADELLARAYPAPVIAPLRDRLDRLHRAYVDVKPGDRYALTYLPGRGTELALNGKPLAVVEGADFARVYFSIWLGEKPIDDGLRDALLGKGLPPRGSGN